MAPIPFYDISIGYYTKALSVLLRILQHVSARPDVDALLYERLAPDMFPLEQQVRWATRGPVSLISALTGKPLTIWDEKQVSDETEKTWPWLIAGVEKTLASLKDISPEEVAAKADDTMLPLQIGPDSDGPDAFRPIAAADFTLANGLPNVFFHV
ncbi:hypothetical protein GGR52DRAFT_312545 [Hypoxylon sp. FL1284]|nr:hypothetical protein GGR52DRAFT_312545 [Hypoxylon sp. FL1284]